jgi:ABC-type bacteriocin/lantibiotic exporter with double-glycine peptidase domain
MVIASVIFWGFSTLTIIAIAILAFDAILGFGIQIRMKKAVEQMKADKRKREIDHIEMIG